MCSDAICSFLFSQLLCNIFSNRIAKELWYFLVYRFNLYCLNVLLIERLKNCYLSKFCIKYWKVLKWCALKHIKLNQKQTKWTVFQKKTYTYFLPKWRVLVEKENTTFVRHLTCENWLFQNCTWNLDLITEMFRTWFPNMKHVLFVYNFYHTCI